MGGVEAVDDHRVHCGVAPVRLVRDEKVRGSLATARFHLRVLEDEDADALRGGCDCVAEAVVKLPGSCVGA